MRKRILALLLALVMAVGLLPTTAWAADLTIYTTDDNNIMAYRSEYQPLFDIHGNYKNDWIKTTYNDEGYQVRYSMMSGVSVTSDAEFINGGKYIKLNYTVTAGSYDITGGKLAVYADIQIGDNDHAPVYVIRDPASGKVIGLKMVNTAENQNAYGAQFNLYFDGTGGVTPVDTYWFGFYENKEAHCYNNLDENTQNAGTVPGAHYTKDSGLYTGLVDCDSAFAISWQNISLQQGESKTFSFIVGVGENADPPALKEENPISLTANITANDNGRTVDVTANVTDASGLTDTLYCSVDGGAEQVVGSVAADGTAKDITGQINLSGLSNGEHTLAFWVVNSSGALSPSVTRTVTVTNDGVEGLDISPAPAHSHEMSVNCETSGDNLVAFTPLNSASGELAAGNYYLTADISLEKPAPDDRALTITGTVNLCLNGHTLSTTKAIHLITVKPGGTLNLCDCHTTGQIKKDGNDQRIINVEEDGTFHFYGGTLGRSETDNAGIGLYNEGSATIYSGKILGNTYRSSGIVNSGHGVLTMLGGEISGNLRGIAVNGGTITISGGKITGNKQAGVDINYAQEVILSGAPVINNNSHPLFTSSNLYIAGDSFTVTIGEGGLTEGADIGVWANRENENTPRSITGQNDRDYSAYFHPDDSKCEIKNGENNVIQLVVAAAPPTIPVITIDTLPDGEINSSYNQTLTATGTTPITWSVTQGTLPSGLNLNTSTGSISGRPTTAGTSTFTVTATNAAGSADKELSITVKPSFGITTRSLPNGTVGTAYSAQMECEGAPDPDNIRWSISNNFGVDKVLPDGLTISTDGTISGIPTTAGTFTFFPMASSGGKSATMQFTITISETAPAPVTPHTCTGMGESVTFDKALTADTLNITESGNYYLPASLNLGDSGVTIGEGITVKLCLNGYDLNYSKNRGEAIKVEKGGALELCDCTGYGHITATDSESAIFLSGAALIQHGGVVSAKKGNGITMSYDDGGDEDDPAQWVASTATIKGGSVLGAAAGINAAGGSLTITGGGIEAKGTNSGSGQPVAALYCMAMDALTISDGQFEGVYGLYLISYGDNGTQLSGGQFYSKAGGHPIYIPDGIVIGEPLTYADLLVNGYAYKDINSGATLTGKEAIEAATAIKVEQGGSTPTPSHTHAWATAWEKNETHHWHECVGAGICDITSNSGKNGYATHTWNDGVVTKEPTATAEGVKTYTCTVCAATKTEPVPIPTFDVSGTVTDSEGTAVEGAAVKLMRGSTQVASTTTDADGNYSFTNVTPGSYNVVAEQTQDGSTKTMTILVTITNANLSNQNLKMPSDSVNSVLEVKGNDTPAVVVGGLEKEAEANKEENSTVTVTMTVEGKEENTAANAAEIKAAAGEDKTLEYLEIKVEKTVEADGSTTTDTISTTSNLLTIVIPFDFTGKVQSSVTVYRYHNGSVDTLTTTASGDGERIVLGADSITLYVKNFSTYAIGYTESAEVNYTVTFDSQGGSAVASQTVAQNGKVTRPVNPTKSGYSFGGWYKETACATAWNFSTDTVTGNTTLYAKWTSSGGTPTGGGGGGYYPTTYPIDIPSGIPNGTVSASPKSASRGTTVTITVIPDEGYEISEVTVKDKDGKEIPITGKGDGKFTFTMPAGKVTVSASFTRIKGSYANCPKDYTCPVWPYTDASVAAWYHDGVHYCIENGLMSGYGNHTFGPDGNTNRAMIATILWRLEGSPVVNYILPFDDVAEGVWYTEAIRWASASGVVSGYGNGKFGPGDPITREQLAAMLYRYEQYKGGGFTGAWMFPLNFTDAELVSSWAYEPMCWTTMNGIINGIGNGQLDPKGKATRAQVATMIMRFCEKI